jgi:hypothetical protein
MFFARTKTDHAQHDSQQARRHQSRYIASWRRASLEVRAAGALANYLLRTARVTENMSPFRPVKYRRKSRQISMIIVSAKIPANIDRLYA